MMLGIFPTFLTFLTRKLCLPALGSDPWLGLEISSDLRRGPLRQSMTRNGDGWPSGALARVLDLLAGGI